MKTKPIWEIAKKDWAIKIAGWLYKFNYDLRPDAEEELLRIVNTTIAKAVEEKVREVKKEIDELTIEDWDGSKILERPVDARAILASPSLNIKKE